MSIAVMAVILSFIGNTGDNAKTDAILKTNEASNQWAYFQSKSIKQSLTKMEADMITLTNLAGTPEAAKKLAELKSKDDTYDKEKEEIKNKAEELQKEAAANSAINDKCDLSALLLQIAVVIASVAILTSWRAMWYAGLALGVAGTIAGVLAYL
jgi:hypothetical protein